MHKAFKFAVAPAVFCSCSTALFCLNKA